MSKEHCSLHLCVVVIVIHCEFVIDDSAAHAELWLSRLKCGVSVALVWFELEVRLCPMGDEVLGMRSPEL